jgi:putative heme iron utilization protein
MFNPEFLTSDSEAIGSNALIQYLQEQPPDVLQRVARSASSEIQDIIRHNVHGLLGMLPGEQFEVKVQTSRENLAGLLASAMMTGYFLRQMEQRMELEASFLGGGLVNDGSESDPGPLYL